MNIIADDAAAAGGQGTGNGGDLPAGTKRARHAGHQGQAGRGRDRTLGPDFRLRHRRPSQGQTTPPIHGDYT